MHSIIPKLASMPQRVPKKIFYSLLLVLLWLGFLVEGSHALLNSSATLASNSLTTGSAGLLVSDSQTAQATGFAPTQPGFTYSIVPGVTQSNYFYLNNDSPANIPLDIDVMANSQAGTNDLTAATNLSFVPVDDNGKATGTAVSIPFNNLESQHTNLGSTVPPGSVQRYRVDQLVAPSYASAGKSITYDLVFTGTQHYTPQQ
jgi:hypothetical protein